MWCVTGRVNRFTSVANGNKFFFNVVEKKVQVTQPHRGAVFRYIYEFMQQIAI